MASMQRSGDRYTWVINSICKALLTSWACDLTPEDTAFVNGDDSAVDRPCTVKQLPHSEWVLKASNGPVGEFSGFLLGGEQPYYSPKGLQYRVDILESRDPSARDKWLAYMDLLTHSDPHSSISVDIASRAMPHLPPDLFRQKLPLPMHAQFFPDRRF
jgi:hypothetical protein